MDWPKTGRTDLALMGCGVLDRLGDFFFIISVLRLLYLWLLLDVITKIKKALTVRQLLLLYLKIHEIKRDFDD